MQLGHRDEAWVKTALEQREKALNDLDKIRNQCLMAATCGDSDQNKLAAYEEIRKLVL
jgi:hypothetical protein